MSHSLYIVTGMHRSGTSLVARMLEVYGIALPGDLVGPASDNEKGFFEDRAFVDLNNEILDRLGARWDALGYFFLDPGDFSAPGFNHLKKRARELLTARHASGADWAFKDPRVARLLGFWLPITRKLDIDVRLVHCIRDPAEVAGSLATRNQFDHLKSLYLWTCYNLEVLRASKDVASIVVPYETLVSDPAGTIEECAGFFPSINSTEQAAFVDDFVTADLRHQREVTLDAAYEPADQLYAALTAGAISDSQTDDLIDLIQSPGEMRRVLDHLSRLESEQIEARQREHDELAGVIEGKEKEIDAFEAYQAKLESNIEQEKSENLKLTRDIEGLNEAVSNQREIVEARDAELARTREDLSAVQTQAKADIDELSGEIKRMVDEARATAAAHREEADRLWAIIEKYRVTVEEMENSHSWKITAPLRDGRRFLQELPSRIGTAVHDLVFSLPPENMFRQRLVKVYERGQLLLKGDIDNQSIRASHHAIIADRSSVLGAKPLLEPADLPILDISVVTYDSSGWVDNFVDSLRRQHYPLEKINICFVDNGSSDDTVSRLNDIDWSGFASFRLIESDNRGYGGGHNLGIAAGTSEFALVTNIDLEFTPDALVSVVSFAVADEAAVASWELRQTPYEHPKFYDPVSLQTGWSAHACILMRRAAFDSAGGYEQKIFMYGEDVELSYRFRAAGYKLRYVPAAVVRHYTYEEANEIKRLQYQGSTLANAYIRMRYGSLVDVFRILPMFSGLLASEGPIADNRKVIAGNIAKIFANAGYFLSRRNRAGHFSFRDWDYDIVRAGAFHEVRDLPDDLPLVSVVTRTYRGRESLLKQCVQSVAHQTYPSVEQVIVEDGGDTMRATVDEMQAMYPDLKITYRPLDKVGRCIAGNEGLAAAHGDYLQFLDDDDLLFADHIEVCMAELLGEDDLSAVYTLAWEVETEFEDGEYEEMSHGTPEIQVQEHDLQVLMHHNYIPIQSIVFDRALFEKHGGFDTELENLEDWNLWIRYASNARFRFIEKTTSMFRTPWDIGEKSRRQAILDSYLPVARQKNEAILGEVAGE